MTNSGADELREKKAVCESCPAAAVCIALGHGSSAHYYCSHCKKHIHYFYPTGGEGVKKLRFEYAACYHKGHKIVCCKECADDPAVIRRMVQVQEEAGSGT